uniref:Uncharacterized protein n=1 Tax=Pipistrellus kuhlii TaxID=59472 RepID=A0A7J7UGP1_PIPKU|nr:hypothetical protein mPipKuh1_013021 [Pipistrellus kuhlii]
MPACCDEMFLYETNKVTRIQSGSYGTIKWFFHMIVFSYVRDLATKEKRGTKWWWEKNMGSKEDSFSRWEMMLKCRWRGDGREGDDEKSENCHDYQT